MAEKYLIPLIYQDEDMRMVIKTFESNIPSPGRNKLNCFIGLLECFEGKPHNEATLCEEEPLNEARSCTP